MYTKHKIFEDFSKIASSSVSTFANIKKDLDIWLKEKLADYMKDYESNQLSELQLMKEMLAKSRIEQEEIKKRLSQLETHLKSKTISTKKTTTDGPHQKKKL